MLIATLSYSKLEIIQLEQEEWAVKGNVLRFIAPQWEDM